MQPALKTLKRYLHKALGLQLQPKPWKGKKDLPFFLKDLYIFFSASLLKKSCILAMARESDAITPTMVRKHLTLLQEKTGIPCIYVSDFASSYNRKRLVAHRVQFVIPGRQIYLPALGIDWLENSQKHHTVPKTVSPSAQAVIIYALMHHEKKQFIPLELAKALNYSTMTMTRALNELESFKFGETVREGKERRFSFIKDQSFLWTQTEPLMQTPVKKRLWLRLKKSGNEKLTHLGIPAGLTTLAELSMLSFPAHPVYAISMPAWKELQQPADIQELPSAEEADVELEVWSYDPRLFANKGLIDLFSLYLSLRDNQDERVETALKKLMKGIKW